MQLNSIAVTFWYFLVLSHECVPELSLQTGIKQTKLNTWVGPGQQRRYLSALLSITRPGGGEERR